MASGRYPAYILTHGSFNPVHKHHIQMMVAARKCLEDAGYTVVGGRIAITNKSRLEYKGVEAVTDEHRLAALKLACDMAPGSPGWLVPESRGVEVGSGNELINKLWYELRAEVPGATLFKVIGSDIAMRYKSEIKNPTVVVCRADGSTAAVRAMVEAAGPSRKFDLFLTSELPGEELSSTKLRKALELKNVEAVRQMCQEAVAEYLLAHRAELYGGSGSAGATSGHMNTTSVKVSAVPSANTTACVQASAMSAAPSSDGMTAAKLKSRWAAAVGNANVLGFYGHREQHNNTDGAVEYSCFSNFFDQRDMPFDFVLPAAVCNLRLGERDRVVNCTCSEKAIMLCKAAAMGDKWSFDQIKTAKTGAAAKSLGRNVQPWDDDLYTRIVCTVAFEVVYQKFSKTPALADILLGTGDRIIAEAAPDDQYWGIRLRVNDPRVNTPSKWQGANILGWALMETRAALRSLSKTGSRSSTNAKASGATTSAPVGVAADASTWPLLDAAQPAKAKRWGKTK